MIPLLRSFFHDFFYDPAKFANYWRALIFGLGELPSVIDFGQAGAPLYWVGKVLQASALGIKAGDRTVVVAPNPGATSVNAVVKHESD